MDLEQLQAIMPAAKKRAALFFDSLTAAMAEYEINTPLRAAAFLAQIAHESEQLQHVREIWGPTAAQSRYEGRKDLGNTYPGDGSRFRGRGLIQLTGRSNYWLAGKALGVDFIERPELLETVDNASRSAAWFWREHQLNELADQRLFGVITRRINGGMNGQAERVALYETALKVMGV
jgi:putative chitinase